MTFYYKWAFTSIKGVLLVEELPLQLCIFTIQCRYTVIHEFATCSLHITFFKPLKVFPKYHWKKIM